MKTVMSRNEEGKVSVGNETFHIPTDKTALSVLATNRMLNGGVYAKDGWVYVNGEPARKWFTNIYYPDGGGNPVKIWEPALKNIPVLEKRWWQMVVKCNKFFRKVWCPAHYAVLNAEKAHAKIDHKHTGELDWWLYEKFGDGISFDWVEIPDKPVNLKIGQHYYKIDKDMERYRKYVAKFEIALRRAIYNGLISKEHPEEAGLMWCITINGRDFWYLSSHNRFGVAVWENVNWPSNNNTTKRTVLE